jgi:hypothetical protein
MDLAAEDIIEDDIPYSDDDLLNNFTDPNGLIELDKTPASTGSKKKSKKKINSSSKSELDKVKRKHNKLA